MSALYPGVCARFYFIEKVCDFINTVLVHIHRFYLITVSCLHFHLGESHTCGNWENSNTSTLYLGVSVWFLLLV